MTDQPVILPPSYLRLLLLILRMAQDGERITQRSLARAEGARFPSYVIIRLKRLRELGLVTFKDGERGTIRPSCYARFYPEALTAGGGATRRPDPTRLPALLSLELAYPPPDAWERRHFPAARMALVLYTPRGRWTLPLTRTRDYAGRSEEHTSELQPRFG